MNDAMHRAVAALLDDLEGVPVRRFVMVVEDEDGGLSHECSGDATESAGLLLRAAMHVASNPAETRQ